MNRQETDQEQFWRTEFGTEYSQRNTGFYQRRMPFFRRVLERTEGVRSACELGANVGENLRALRELQPSLELAATEINPSAVSKLRELEGIEATLGAIQDYSPKRRFDLVFTCGVLIHLAPASLGQTYVKMFELSERFVLINEYFNPVPTEIPYRGHSGKLFKRDFAGEFWDLHGDKVEVVDYGFLWKRVEPAWDDTTWTLFKKV